MRPTARAGIIIVALAVATTTASLGFTAPSSAAAATATEGEPGEMMLVMDSSGSMREPATGGRTKIQVAKDSLGTVIDELPADAPVGLRVYGAEVEFRNQAGACTDSQRVVDVGTDNRADLREAVRSYRPYGETPIGYALQQAAKDLGEEGRRTIVLVSDGEPTCRPDPCDVAKKLSKDGIELRIDVVGLDVSGKARRALSCIADHGNGTYYDAEDSEQLTGALSTVAERAATPYEPIGSPITGGPSADDAAEITSGDWLDTIGAAGSSSGERWYRFERTIPGSTVHLSATIQNARDEDAMHVEVYAGNTECGYAQGSGPSTYRPLIVAALASPGSRDFD